MGSGGSMSPSTGSTSSSFMGTPTISSSSFTGNPLQNSAGYQSGPGHIQGAGNILLPLPSSKASSPHSPHGGSGPSTPNLSASGISTPGMSPIGTSHIPGLYNSGSSSCGGLGTGSPAWNVSANANIKATPGLTGQNIVNINTMGLQLSNIKLSPGSLPATMRSHHQLPGQARPGHLTPVGTSELGAGATGGGENISPGVIGSRLAPGGAIIGHHEYLGVSANAKILPTK